VLSSKPQVAQGVVFASSWQVRRSPPLGQTHSPGPVVELHVRAAGHVPQFTAEHPEGATVFPQFVFAGQAVGQVKQDAEPPAPVHGPLAQVMFGVWRLQPFASFEHVTRVVALEQVGPIVPVQTASPLHVQLALFAGPVQLWCVGHATGVPLEKQPLDMSAQVARFPLTHDFWPCVQVLVQVKPHVAFGALPVQTWGAVHALVVETKRQELASVAQVATVCPSWQTSPVRVQAEDAQTQDAEVPEVVHVWWDPQVVVVTHVVQPLV
jgi:hypothetical protein